MSEVKALKALNRAVEDLGIAVEAAQKLPGMLAKALKAADRLDGRRGLQLASIKKKIASAQGPLPAVGALIDDVLEGIADDISKAQQDDREGISRKPRR